MISLLDTNVLIALVDSDLPHNQAATAFLKEAMRDGWATGALTENGFLRILGDPRYQRGPDSPQEARKLVAAYLAARGHQFWPDDVSLAETAPIPNLPASKGLTDLYLLALAVKHGGRLATFDHHIDAALVPGGPAAYLILPLI